MHRNQASLPILLAGLIVLAGPAAAQTSVDEGGEGGAKTRTNAVSANAQAQAQAQASADLSAARAKLEQRAEKTSTKARNEADAKLEAAEQKVDAQAARAEQKVAARLANELDVDANALVEQRSRLDASWGELMIAHSLAQNASGSSWTAEGLVGLHQDGMGWGRIAAGLGFELGSAVNAIDHEAKVALGQARADGRVQAMAGSGTRIGAGAGANAGVGASGATAGVGGSVSTATGGAGSSVTSGVGLKLGR